MLKRSAGIQVLSDPRLYETTDPSRPSSAIPKVPFIIAHDMPLGTGGYHAKNKQLQDRFSANVATEFGSALLRWRIRSIAVASERNVQMFALLNSKERTVDDYQRIVALAEPEFKFCGITTAPEHWRWIAGPGLPADHL
ncbi:hypothetical protein N7467_001328 [Penicillium canescens]|nr:hypothetical protein N7467_001328 [Penicillium canescens]